MVSAPDNGWVVFRPTTAARGSLSLVNEVLAMLYSVLNAGGGLFVLEEPRNIPLSAERNAKSGSDDGIA
jgi:hypothetical protein